MSCTPKCTYFPDAIYKDVEWELEDYKKCKFHKPLKCAFDNHEITSWDTLCPKHNENLYLEDIKEEIENTVRTGN